MKSASESVVHMPATQIVQARVVGIGHRVLLVAKLYSGFLTSEVSRQGDVRQEGANISDLGRSWEPSDGSRGEILQQRHSGHSS